MGFDPNDDSDNDLPDWLKGMQSDEDSGGYEPDESFSPDSEEDLPSWLEDDQEGGFSGPEEDDDDSPEWLENLRSQADSESEQHTPEFSPSEEDEDDDQSWLESIREKAASDSQIEVGDDDEDVVDFLDKIQEIKDKDQAAGMWGDEEEDFADIEWESSEPEEDPVASAWDDDSGALEAPEQEEEDDVPDWVSGLPSLDPAEEPVESEEPVDEPTTDEDDVPEWLRVIRQKTSEDTKQPEDVLPAMGVSPELREETGDEEVEPTEDQPVEQADIEEEAEEVEEVEDDGIDHVTAFSERPMVTASLPTWLENLQTSGLVMPTEEQEDEERLKTTEYIEEEDVSTLFEDTDLPDWLGEEREEEPEPEEEEVEEEELPKVPALDEDIPRGELPSWLQAMRPLDAVTDAPDPFEDVGEEEEEREQETVGPLAGLHDVLPAEPHIIHFGTKPKLAQGFELTDAQKHHAKLLKSLVDEETAVLPVQTRGVANPQQVLRWIIGILLLTITFSVLWWNGNILPLPSPMAIPEENLAAISLVNEIGSGDKVLVAFEYQPGLAGEMQAASAALLDDLVWSGADLVLVSSQPVGPGLADTFLQSQFSDSAYIAGEEYSNLGYLAGGAAGLLNFAIDPRLAKPSMSWDQAPLNAVQTIRDFSLVLVITDDPDVARSWVEQVQPLLDLEGNGQGVPLVMIVSAQAEPLVYPYYYSTPRQVSGLVSGMSGGAFYESIHGPLLARRYWDAYNLGLVLAVLVVAIGSVFNLMRTTLSRTDKGRS